MRKGGNHAKTPILLRKAENQSFNHSNIWTFVRLRGCNLTTLKTYNLPNYLRQDF